MVELLPEAFEAISMWPRRNCRSWWFHIFHSLLSIRISSTIYWSNIRLCDLAFADWAFLVVGVNIKPLIQARPAEKMAAGRDYRLTSHIKTYVTLKSGG